MQKLDLGLGNLANNIENTSNNTSNEYATQLKDGAQELHVPSKVNLAKRLSPVPATRDSIMPEKIRTGLAL